MKLMTLFIMLWAFQADAVKSAKDHVPIEHKQVSFSRAELAEEYPLMNIKCGIQIIALDQLIYVPKNVRTKPNRYLFADWKMSWNELLCEFKKANQDQ